MTTEHQPRLFDIGVNLTSGQFRGQMDAVLERAYGSGVAELIAIASDEAESKLLNELEKLDEPRVWITAGVHPHQAKTFNRETPTVIRSCSKHDRCVAIGECGLDYNRMYSPQADQLFAFEAQIDIALDTNLPLYLHERDAHDDFVSVLRTTHSTEQVRGVIHCFTGDRTQLKTYLDLGLYVGVTGWVCDERRGDALRDALRYVPIDRLLLETDAPYLKPRTYKGPLKLKMNEPCLLPHIADEVAHLIGLSPQQLSLQTRMNACRLFRISDAQA